jgi:hypothetical protein
MGDRIDLAAIRAAAAREASARVDAEERRAIQDEGRASTVRELRPLPTLPLVSLEDLAGPLPDVPYVVRELDLCPGAPAILAGYGFSGKTIAVQSMAVALAAEQRVWGAFFARGGPVLHVDYEQGRRLTIERYQRLALGLDVDIREIAPRLHVACMPPVYLDSRQGLEALARSADGHALVIVDSLRACAPRVDENASDVRRVIDGLGRVSEQTGACVILITHARKPGPDKQGGARMSIRGSGAIYDAASSVLVLEAAEQNEPKRVTHEKARTSGILAQPFYLAVEDVEIEGRPRAGLRVRYLAEEAVRVPVTAADNFAKLKVRVVDLIRREPGLRSRGAIAERVGARKASVLQAIAELLDEGSIRDLGEGGYRVG